MREVGTVIEAVCERMGLERDGVSTARLEAMNETDFWDIRYILW
jgi:hypothetical protein